MKTQKTIKNKMLAVTIGSVLSIVSIPSATTVTAVVATTTITSLSLTTDAYANKSQADYYDDAIRHWGKAQDAYDKGKTRKGNRHARKGNAAADKANGRVMVNPETGEGDVNPGLGF